MKCIVCDSSNSSSIMFSKKGEGIDKNYDINRCKDCGFVFVDPLPSKNELNEYYNRNFGGVLLETEKDVNRKAKEFLKISEKLGLKGRLLEIGCSYGFFLNILKEKNWDVKGTELAKDSVKFAKEKYRLDVREGSLEELKFKEKFDVIVMFDVLEHTRNPDEQARIVNNLLNENGIFVLTTPNIRSLDYFLNGKYWDWMIPPAHLNYFSTKTIKRFLKKNGFKVIYLKTSKGDAKNIVYAFLLALLKRIGLKERIREKLTNEKGEIDKKSKKRVYSYLYMVEILTYPFYFILYPFIWIKYRLGFGPSMIVFARKEKNLLR